MITAQGRHASALLRAFAGPVDHAVLRNRQLEARRARRDAEASVDRLSEEPPHPPLTADRATSILAASRRMAQADLGLAAAVHQGRRTEPDPCIEVLASAVEMATSAIADRLRRLDLAWADRLSLRPTLDRLQAAQAEVAKRHQPDNPALVAATDTMVDALEAMGDLLDQAFTAPQVGSAAARSGC
jgi:hypothetical protein